MSKYLWMIEYARHMHRLTNCGWRAGMRNARMAVESYPLDWPDWEPAEAVNEDISYWD